MNRDVANRDTVVCEATEATGLAAELARWSAYTLTALLLVGVGTMWCRRWARALEQPLDWPGLLLVGVVAAGTCAAARMLLRRPAPACGDRAAVRTFDWVMSLGLVAWGIALSLSGTQPGGLISFWSVVAGEELWAWRHTLGWSRRLGNLIGAGGSRDTHAGMSRPAETQAQGLLSGRLAPLPGDVLQEFVRSRQPDGAELLTGWMRVPLSPGQRSAAVHLAFCPPFVRTPRITVAQQEGPTARIKEAQVLPFGARLDLKLAQATDTCATVLLEIMVQTDPAADPASLSDDPRQRK